MGIDIFNEIVKYYIENTNIEIPIYGDNNSIKTNYGIIGKNGVKYRKHGAVCLETQCFPDTPNIESFPSCVLQPGQTMKAKTIYSFNF